MICIFIQDEPRDMEEMVNTIRVMLRTMGDGEISASAYDTAWVALVKNHNGSDSPQFPSTIDWISHNQLPDGSWGDDLCFLVHDRLLNTLACVIALMEWKVHGDKREKGTIVLADQSVYDEWLFEVFGVTVL